MSDSPFRGVGTALVTPFHQDGSLDLESFRTLIRHQLANGTHFLVPIGTTGEVPTLSGESQRQLVATTLEEAAGKAPVMIGCGGNNTFRVIERALVFKALGATHLLSVSPYYNRPTQEGIYRHFSTLAEKTGLGICVYNIQARTGSNIETDTLMRLARSGAAFGVKEASGSIVQIQKVIQAAPPGFQVFAGDDALTLPLMASGGAGVIAVTSNVAPKLMSGWLEELMAGDLAAGRRTLAKLLPLMEALSAETNPIPVKAALALQGRIGPTLRLPMVEAQPATVEKLRQALQALDLLQG